MSRTSVVLPSRSWIKALPHSRIVFPSMFWDRLKYIFWRLYTPYHPFFRDLLLGVGVLQHVGRQDFLLGNIAPGQTIESIALYLVDHGYGKNHFIAWKDDGEVLGMRLVDGFTYQYHIRFFKDGEVRAHYEYTPECHPVYHMKEIGMENRREEFLTILKGKVVPL